MDYLNASKLCATCNRWGGKRIVLNPIQLPGYEVVRCGEIPEGTCNGSEFITDASMGLGCKRYIRWVGLESTVLQLFLEKLNSKWIARRHFKESKVRDVVDVVVNKVAIRIAIIKLSPDYYHPWLRNIVSWLDLWIVEPIFTLMYRLKLTTCLPVANITIEDLDGL